jgi:DNA-binding NarL/FixJ family response regulator
MKLPPYHFFLIGDSFEGIKEEFQLRNHTLTIAKSEKEALRILKLAQKKPFDAILMALTMSGSGCWDILRKIRIYPQSQNLPVIVLSNYEDESTEIQALYLGADDYLPAKISIKLLLARLEAHIRKSSNALTFDDDLPFDNNSSSLLTRREKEILMYVIKGFTNKEIAEKVYITNLTAANHVKTILKKLNVKNRTQAVVYAIKHNLVSNYRT